jgi:hypothetical protein
VNWGELKDQINNYCENVFADTQLAVFAQQAEQRIFNTVQFPSLRKNVTGFTSINNRYLQCPSDFLAPYSMAAMDANGQYHYLLNKDVNFIREAYPIPTGAGNTGRPKHYALFGPDYSAPKELTFLLGPTPDAAYEMELHYFFYPSSISDGNVDSTTTWLSDNFDTVLLYGSLVEAYTFLKGEPDMVGLITNQYKEALALAKRLGDGMERQDAYRSGQFRMPVT